MIIEFGEYQGDHVFQMLIFLRGMIIYLHIMLLHGGGQHGKGAGIILI